MAYPLFHAFGETALAGAIRRVIDRIAKPPRQRRDKATTCDRALSRRRLVFEPLEPRLLLSADPLSQALQVAVEYERTPSSATVADGAVIRQALAPAAMPAAESAAPPTGGDVVSSLSAHAGAAEPDATPLLADSGGTLTGEVADGDVTFTVLVLEGDAAGEADRLDVQVSGQGDPTQHADITRIQGAADASITTTLALDQATLGNLATTWTFDGEGGGTLQVAGFETLEFSNIDALVEARAGANENIRPVFQTGLDRLDEIAEDLSGSDALSIELPFVDQSINDVVDIGALLSYADAVRGMDAGWSFFDLVDSLDTRLGEALPGGVTADVAGELMFTEATEGTDVTKELKLDFNIDFQAQQSRELELGAQAASLGLGLEAAVEIEFNVNVDLQFSLGVDLSDLITGGASGPTPNEDAFFLDLRSATATALSEVDLRDVGLRADLGLANGSLDITAGKIALDAGLNLLRDPSPNDSGRITFDELDPDGSTSILDLSVLGSPSASADLSMSGVLEAGNIKLDGDFTLSTADDSVDLFAGDWPDLDLGLDGGSLTIGDFLSATGDFTFSQETQTVSLASTPSESESEPESESESDTTVPQELENASVLKVGIEVTEAFAGAEGAGLELFEAEIGLAYVEEAAAGSVASFAGQGAGTEDGLQVQDQRLGHGVVPGSVTVTVEDPASRESAGVLEGEEDGTVQVLTDDGNGDLIDFEGNPRGSVDYASGTLSFNVSLQDGGTAEPVDYRVDFQAVRSWLALEANFAQAELQGLPDDMEATVSEAYVSLNQTAPGLVQAADDTATDSPTFIDFSDKQMDIPIGDRVITLDYGVDITEIGGKIDLDFDLAKVHADFTLRQDTVDVDFDDEQEGIDLTDARLLMLDLSLREPVDGGPALAIDLDGVGFGVDSGELTLATLSGGENAPVYTAFLGSLSGAELTGLPEDDARTLSIEAARLDVALNTRHGDLPVGNPERLDWTTMVGSAAGDGFEAQAISVGGRTIDLDAEQELSIGGQLRFDIDGTVLGWGAFNFSQLQNQAVEIDGESTDRTLHQFSIEDLNLFVGVQAGFEADAAGNLRGFDDEDATGFSATGGNLTLMVLTDAGNRSWMALKADATGLSTHGLPDETLELEFQDLELLYNVGAADDTRVSWEQWTALGLDVDDATVDADLDFAVTGGVYLNASGLVVGSGSFSIATATGLAVDDGHDVSVDAAALLRIAVSDLDLFIGTGGEGISRTGYAGQDAFRNDLEASGAQGFFVVDANLEIAVVGEQADPAPLDTPPRTWIGLAAQVETLTPIGLPDGIVVTLSDLGFDYNIAAGDDSHLDWSTLAGQDGDGFLLDGTALTDLTRNDRFQVAGETLIVVQGYVHLSGRMALERRDVTARRAGSNVDMPMSLLAFGASDLRAFAGLGQADSDGDGVVDDDETLRSNGARGISVGIDHFALALLRPTAVDDTRHYFALDGSGNGALLGIDGVTLAGEVQIAVNQGRDSALQNPADAAAIDFGASAAAAPGAYGDVTGLKVATGDGGDDFVVLDFDARTLAVRGSVELGIADFIELQGRFSMEQRTGNFALADETTVSDASVLTIGVGDADGYVGVEGTGLSLRGVDLALAHVEDPADSARNWLALKGSAASAELVGINGITAATSNVEIALNQGSGVGNDTVLDLSEDPLAVWTGPGDDDTTTLSFDSPIRSISGDIVLNAFDLLTVNAEFSMIQDTVDVDFAGDGVDLHEAQLTMMDLTLKDPDAYTDADGNPATGPGRGLFVGAPGGMGFGVESGRLTLAALSANADADKRPTDFQRSYSALFGNVAGATFDGLPGDVLIEATALNLVANRSAGSATEAPERLDWTTMIDLEEGGEFEADTPVVAGRAVDLVSSDELSIDGTLKLDIDGFVLGSGSFTYEQTRDRQVSDGATLSSPTQATVQTISIDDLNLFVGLNGGFSEDEDGTALMLADATGVSAQGGSLQLIAVTENFGTKRSWMGLAAHVDEFTLHGLPSDIRLGFQDLDLIYNAPDATGERLDWSSVTIDTVALGEIAAFAGTDTPLAEVTATMEFAVSGSVALNLSDLVVGVGDFTMSKQSGLILDDGHGIALSDASALRIALSDVDLFVGTGGDLDPAGYADGAAFAAALGSVGAQGFYAVDAGLDIAIVGEEAQDGATAPRSWVGVAAAIGEMGQVGLPDETRVTVSDLDIRVNIAAADDSRLDWRTLAEADADPLGIDAGPLAGLAHTDDFAVAGSMLLAIESYVFVSGRMSLERRVLNARAAEDGAVGEEMSVLTFGARDARAFVGSGAVDGNNDGALDTDAELAASGALGVSLRIDDMALALLTPTAVDASARYYALDASGGAALIGIDDVTLEGTLHISVNQGRDSSLPVPADAAPIDFAASAAADADGYGSADGLRVATGPLDGDTTVLDFDRETLLVEGFVSLGLSEFAYASGHFAIEKAEDLDSVTLAGDVGTVNDVSLLKIGADSVNAFVGVSGPYWTADLDGDGEIDADEVNETATGVALDDVAVGLVLMKETAPASGPGGSFYALKAGGAAKLVGIDALNLEAENLLVEVNDGMFAGTQAAVDFSATFGGDGLEVATGTDVMVFGGDSADPDGVFNDRVLRASGAGSIGIGEFVEVEGKFAIGKGGTRTATLSDGSAKEVSIVTVGVSEANSFMGIIADDAADNIGLSLTGGEFGLALLTPTDVRDSSRYYGLTGGAESVDLVGLEGIGSFSLTDTAFLVNGGSDAVDPNRVVDFGQGDLDGTDDGRMTIATGPDSAVELDMAEELIKVSGNVSVALLSGAVRLDGAAALKVSQQDIVLSDASETQLTASALEIGVYDASASIVPDPDNPDGDNVTLGGVTLGLAYYTPEDQNYTGIGHSWLGLKTFGGTVQAGSTVGGIEVSDIQVSLNKGYGEGNLAAVDFSKSYEEGLLRVDTGGRNDVLDEPITVDLDFSGELLSLQADTSIEIGDYFFARGTAAWTDLGGSQWVTLAGTGAGQSVEVSIRQLELTDASVFAGDNGPYLDEDGGVNANAVGFSLSGVDFVALELTEVGGDRSWDALYAQADAAELVGIDTFDLPSATNIAVRLNSAALDGSWVDFASSDWDGGNDDKLSFDNGLVIDYTERFKEVSAAVAFAIDDYIYIDGEVAFRSGGTATATLSDEAETTKDVSIMTLAARDVNVFVGAGGPYWSDTDDDGLRDDDEYSESAAGLSILDANLGLTMFKPTAKGDSSSYYALRASADQVALVGFEDDLTLEVNGLDIKVNSGDEQGRVIDFTKSDLDSDGSADGADGFTVSDGDDPIRLDFTSRLTEVRADDALLDVSGFLQIRGGFAYAKQADQLVTLSDGTSKRVDITTFGFDNLQAFAGAGPYFQDTDGDGVFEDDEVNGDAAGLVLSDGALAVALFKPVSTTDRSSYYAVSATLDEVALPGLVEVDSDSDSDSFQLSASGYRVEINGGTDGATRKTTAVNFTTLADGKLSVVTGADSVDFDFRSPLQRVAIENATLIIDDYVHVSGGMSFTRQEAMEVELSGNAGGTTTVDAYAFGAGNVNIFAGSGPYFIDSDNDGDIDGLDTRDADAMGVAAENVDFGLLLMKQQLGSKRYLALKAEADRVGLVGIDDVELSAAGLKVEYNSVIGSGVVAITPVVDFQATFGSELTVDTDGDGTADAAGYALDTGNGALAFDFDDRVLRAATSEARLRIAGYAIIEGALAFEKGGNVQARLSGAAETRVSMSAINIGARDLSMFFGVDGPADNAGAVGVSLENLTLGLALLRPTSSLDKTRYIGLSASADSFEFVGVDKDMFDLGSDRIELDLNLKSGGTADAARVVDFAAFGDDGYAIDTGDGLVHLTESQRRIRAAVDDVRLNVGGFLDVEGSFALDLGSRTTVTVDTGIPASIANFIPDDIPEVVNAALQRMDENVEDLEETIQIAFQDVVETVKTTVDDLVDDVVDTVEAQLQATLADAKSAVNTMVSDRLDAATDSLSLSSVLDQLLDPVVDAIAGQNPTLRSVLDDYVLAPATSMLTEPFNALLQEALSTALTQITESVGGAIEAGADRAADRVKTAIRNAIDPQIALVQFKLDQLIDQINATLDPIFTELERVTAIRFGSGFSSIQELEVEVTTFGISDANAFVGLPPDGGFDFDAAPDDQDAIGLYISDLTMGLGLFKPTMSGPLPNFTALKLHADAAGFTDGGADILELTARNIDVELNLGGPIVPGGSALLGNATIDFSADPFQVPIGASSSLELDFKGERMLASVGNATISISEFVHVTGSIAFEMGTVHTVAVTGGLTGGAVDLARDLLPDDAQDLIDNAGIPAFGATTTEVSFMTIGASNVNAFVGLGGPYWELDDNGDAVAPASSDATGIVIEDFDFGLAMMRPTLKVDFAKYFALSGAAEQLSLVGIDGVELTAERLLVEVNQSSPSVYGVPLFPVVDFANTPDFASEELALFDTNDDGKITMGELRALNAVAANRAGVSNGLSDDAVVDHDLLLDILDTTVYGETPRLTPRVIDLEEAAVMFGGGAAALDRVKAADADGDGKIDPLGFELNTGLDPVYLAMDSWLIKAEGAIDLDLFSAITLTGTFAFELGPTMEVQTVGLLGNPYSVPGLDGLVTPQDEVLTMTIGASNVSAFIGWNGPYFEDKNRNGEIDAGELNDEAKGLALTDVDVGLFAGLSTTPNPAAGGFTQYFAGDFSVGSVGLVGLDDFVSLNATLRTTINASYAPLPGVPRFIDFQSSFADTGGLEVNTGDPSFPVLLDATGPAFSIELAGELGIQAGGNALASLLGIFFLEVDTASGFKLLADAALRIGPDIDAEDPLLDVSAFGVAILNADGFAADLDVGLEVGLPILELDVDARVILNTTGEEQSVTVPDRLVEFLEASASPLAAATLARLDDTNTYRIAARAPDISKSATVTALLDGGTVTYVNNPSAYVVGVVRGEFDFLGFATGRGTAGIGVSAERFQLFSDLDFSVGVSGISLDFEANGALDISSAGLDLRAAVTLNAEVTSLLALNASGNLIIDTTGANDIFVLDLGGDLTVAEILEIGGDFRIEVGTGGADTWYVGMNLGGDLGPISTTANGFIQSDGQFSLAVAGELDWTKAGFGIKADLGGVVSLTKSGTNYVYSPDDIYTLRVEASGGAKLMIAGLGLGASVTLGGTATLGAGTASIALYAEGCVDLLLTEVCAGGTIASVTVPASIFPGGSPPVLAGMNGDQLVLYAGTSSSQRTVAVDDQDEHYVLSRRGANGVRVEAFGITQDFENVGSIATVDFAAGNDSLTLASGFHLDVTADGGAGDDRLWSYGDGVVTFRGGDDDDILVGGSAADTLSGGAGDDLLQGGAGNDVLTGGAGDDIVMGEAGDDEVRGTFAELQRDRASGGDHAETGDTLVLTGGGLKDYLTLAASFGESFFQDASGRNQVFGSVTRISGETESAEVAQFETVRVTPGGDEDTLVFSGNLKQASGVERVLVALEGDGGASDHVTTILASSDDLVAMTGTDGGAEIGWSQGQDVQITGLGSLVVNTVGGADQVNVLSVGAETSLNLGAGDDAVLVTSTAPGAEGTLDGVAAELTVNGDAGTDTLTVDDQGNRSGATGTLSATRLSGLGMAGGITYATLETLDIALGDFGNVFAIDSTADGTHTLLKSGVDVDYVTVGAVNGLTDIDTEAGADVVRIIPSADGPVDSIVDTADGGSAINGLLRVDGGGAAFNQDLLRFQSAFASAVPATLTGTRLTGLGMPEGIEYSAFGEFQIDLNAPESATVIVEDTHQGTTGLSTGEGGDTVQILSNSGKLRVNTKGGADRVAIREIAAAAIVDTGFGGDLIHVGSEATASTNEGGTLDGIKASLWLYGGNDRRDRLILDETGERPSAARRGELTASSLRGLGMGVSEADIGYEHGIRYSRLGDVELNLGDAGVALRVIGTHSGTTRINAGGGFDDLNVSGTGGVTLIDTGGGEDRLRFRTQAQTSTINTGADADRVYLDIQGGVTTLDTGSGTDRIQGSVKGGRFIADGGAGENSMKLKLVNSNATLGGGGEADAFDLKILSGTTDVDADAGADVLIFEQIRGTLDADMGDGDDRLDAITSGARVDIAGNAGKDRLNIVATRSLVELTGGSGDDQLHLTANGSTVDLDSGEADDQVESNSTDSTVSIGTGGGEDTIVLTRTGGITEVQAGADADIIDVHTTRGGVSLSGEGGADVIRLGRPESGGQRDTGGLSGRIDVDGGSETDHLLVDNSGASVGIGFIVDADSLSGVGTAVFDYTGIDNMDLRFGGGADNIAVRGTAANTNTEISTAGGADRVRISAIEGPLRVDLGGGDDAIQLGGETGMGSLGARIDLDGGAGDDDHLMLLNKGVGAVAVGDTTITGAAPTTDGIGHRRIERIEVDAASLDDQTSPDEGLSLLLGAPTLDGFPLPATGGPDTGLPLAPPTPPEIGPQPIPTEPTSSPIPAPILPPLLPPTPVPLPGTFRPLPAVWPPAVLPVPVVPTPRLPIPSLVMPPLPVPELPLAGHSAVAITTNLDAAGSLGLVRLPSMPQPLGAGALLFDAASGGFSSVAAPPVPDADWLIDPPIPSSAKTAIGWQS